MVQMYVEFLRYENYFHTFLPCNLVTRLTFNLLIIQFTRQGRQFCRQFYSSTFHVLTMWLCTGTRQLGYLFSLVFQVAFSSGLSSGLDGSLERGFQNFKIVPNPRSNCWCKYTKKNFILSNKNTKYLHSSLIKFVGLSSWRFQDFCSLEKLE